MKKVAFICVHNSCRSQIAEALGKHLTSDVFDKIEPIDLTRAVIFHINAKEDRLYEDDNYDGNIIPYFPI